MPCNSDHMESTSRELQLSRVACLLDELSGKKINPDHWSGYHPDIYCKSVDADAYVSKLCAKLQKVNIKTCSLEAQIWWRDHQAADAARLQKEMESAKTASSKAEALAKLTPYERKLLGH